MSFKLLKPGYTSLFVAVNVSENILQQISQAIFFSSCVKRDSYSADDFY